MHGPFLGVVLHSNPLSLRVQQQQVFDERQRVVGHTVRMLAPRGSAAAHRSLESLNEKRSH